MNGEKTPESMQCFLQLSLFQGFRTKLKVKDQIKNIKLLTDVPKLDDKIKKIDFDRWHLRFFIFFGL